ncbi:hypothetical protein ACRAWF_23375 [Streptomyces sp. L7]
MQVRDRVPARRPLDDGRPRVRSDPPRHGRDLAARRSGAASRTSMTRQEWTRVGGMTGAILALHA